MQMLIIFQLDLYVLLPFCFQLMFRDMKISDRESNAGVCLLDDNDDEPTGSFHFGIEKERKRKRTINVSLFASSGTNK